MCLKRDTRQTTCPRVRTGTDALALVFSILGVIIFEVAEQRALINPKSVVEKLNPPGEGLALPVTINCVIRDQ